MGKVDVFGLAAKSDTIPGVFSSRRPRTDMNTRHFSQTWSIGVLLLTGTWPPRL